MGGKSFFESLFLALPDLKEFHDPSSTVSHMLKQMVRREVEAVFREELPVPADFGPFGDLIFPYQSMGNLDSLNLFDLDELIIFSFYWINRGRYRLVLDAGANLGLHSIVLSRCDFEVRAYEPDPHHFEILEKNIILNNCSNVQTVNAAVSSREDILEFVRVIGNTMSSHIAGSKANPYGDLERFPVQVEAIGPLLDWADLVKLDVEGHEKEILLTTSRETWLATDALVEVENAANASSIYEHFKSEGVRLFSQKTNWKLVHAVADMPTSYREGTLFITCKDEMPWK